MPNARAVRKARQYLRKHAHASVRDISPAAFAAAADEQQASFGDLLKYISRLYAGGQSEQSQRQEDIHAAAKAGK